jgi:deazaflavin-dependent oxidoreductase (nitroreductase family)
MPEEAMAWEEALIADIREHGGRPTSGPLAGHPLLVMYSRGAQSGSRRRAILTYSRDGESYIVAGSAGGSPRDPAWVANVRAHPDVTVEVGRDSLEATAAVVEGPERERLWDGHVAALPWFADYPDQSGRTIPVARLTPTER